MSQTSAEDVQQRTERTARDPKDKAQEKWLGRLARWIDSLWGYDVFISHRRSDAALYARALHKTLETDNTNSFIDATHFVPGDPLPQATLRNVRKSTLLVALITPKIAEPRFPDWVLTELDAYLISHVDEPRIIAVFFTDDPSVLAHPIVQKLKDFLRIELSASALDSAPSDEVVAAIRSQLGSRRRDRGRIRLFQLIAVVVSVLAVLAATTAGGFWAQWTLAAQNAREATSRLLAFESSFERPNFPQRSLLLAAASVETTRTVDQKVLPESFIALLEGLQLVGGKPIAPELGKFQAFDGGDSGLVLGKKQTGELFTLYPFEDVPEARTIALPTGAKAVSAAIAGGQLLVLDETSSIVRCLITQTAASACEKVLTVDGAGTLSHRRSPRRDPLTQLQVPCLVSRCRPTAAENNVLLA